MPPFGVTEIDHKLAGGGLTLDALHGVAGGGNDALSPSYSVRPDSACHQWRKVPDSCR